MPALRLRQTEVPPDPCPGLISGTRAGWLPPGRKLPGVPAGSAPGQAWQVLASLIERAQAARSVPEILLHCRQRDVAAAAVSSGGDLANELAQPAETAHGLGPCAARGGFAEHRLAAAARAFLYRRGDDETMLEPSFLSRDDVPPDLAEHWDEFMPALVYVLPLPGPRGGRRLGMLALALDAAPTDLQQELVRRAAAGFGHAWEALVAPAPGSVGVLHGCGGPGGCWPALPFSPCSSRCACRYWPLRR